MKQTIILPEKATRTVTFTVTEDIDPKQWVHVNGTPYFVSAGNPLYIGFNNQQAIEKTLKETPFRVTPPRIFMPHLTQVYNAVRKRNPVKLYDGAGEPLSKFATEDFYQRRMTDTWVHLDARFELLGDRFLLLTDHALVDGELQPTTQQSLEHRVIREEGFVELQWNSQGLPVKMSKRQDEHERGRNMHYSPPTDNGFVNFLANPDGVFLYCYYDADEPNDNKGVLFYTEGIPRKK